MSYNEPALAEVEQRLARHGHSDLAYLRSHYPRFAATLREFRSTWPASGGRRVLDIGAHWLHQSLLWAHSGFAVTALDLPDTLGYPSVRSLAAELSIELIDNADLEHPVGLRELATDSVDVVLFTEIIEHLTFNPLALWREIHRLMAPAARIVVTTPNYYRLGARAWHWGRFLRGGGGGLGVDEVLSLHTHAHHWKEYSRAELIDYFGQLSADFRCVKARHLTEFRPYQRGGRSAPIRRAIESALPLLRPNLHVEIELTGKRHGVSRQPRW